MSQKHSIGDWFYSEMGGEVISMPFQTKICSRVSGNNYEEAKANGRLISLAPKFAELLDIICNGKGEGFTNDQAIIEAQSILNTIK